MAIYQIAHYRVKPKAVAKVKKAIKEFVRYVKANEPGTRMYVAWQQKRDPTRFSHLFIFRNAAAHRAHGESKAVKKFESVYGPELASRGVDFVDYEAVATN